jgi:hypothetical protein
VTLDRRRLRIRFGRALLAHAEARTTEQVYRRKPKRVEPLCYPALRGLSTGRMMQLRFHDTAPFFSTL